MRALARRFTARSIDGNEKDWELRLLPQPLYRFSDEAGGILDGGLFAFVVSNDPEFFVLLEAITAPQGEPQWRYSLARMSSRKHAVRLDGNEVWSVTNYYTEPRTTRTTGPYA